MELKKFAQIITVLSLIIFLTNCKKTTESEVDWGNADFTSFVSLGNSLTAGVADGALYEDSQKNSFPNLIAKMAEVDDDFEQPLMGGNGFSFNESEGRLSINIISNSMSFLPAGTEKNRGLNRAYNNLGIPLIRANQLYTSTTAVEADSNHFVDKILRGSGRTAIQEALSLDPTLITLWVGNNDVLEAASLGLADSNYTYTDPNDFETHFNNIVTELVNCTNAPILVANIIDLTDLPYFTSLPSSVKFGGNDVYMFGECDNDVRQLTDDDLVLFWALPDYMSYITTGNINLATALNDTLILDAEEKVKIQNVIEDYNDIIENIANSNDQLILVDTYTLFKNIAQNGYKIDGETYEKDIIYFDDEGNLSFYKTLFSFDGLHPNKYGYISIANTFIEKINSSFNASIPLAN